jgi:hypothetical protein
MAVPATVNVDPPELSGRMFIRINDATNIDAHVLYGQVSVDRDRITMACDRGWI